MVPPELKNLNDVETFISQVRDGSKNNANANSYIQNAGFVNISNY